MKGAESCKRVTRGPEELSGIETLLYSDTPLESREDLTQTSVSPSSSSPNKFRICSGLYTEEVPRVPYSLRAAYEYSVTNTDDDKQLANTEPGEPAHYLLPSESPPFMRSSLTQASSYRLLLRSRASECRPCYPTCLRERVKVSKGAEM